MTDDELLAELRTAFPPRRIDASTAFAKRGRLYCDIPEVSAVLHGKTWEDIDAAPFSRRSDALYFLNDEHLRAVLPRALHLMNVLGPLSAIGQTMQFLLRRAAPGDGPRTYAIDVPAFERWFGDLDLAQRRAVARAIVEFGARYPNYADVADDLLDRHWRTWLEDSMTRTRSRTAGEELP